MKYLSIKNLEKHQHYKDRRPPWIKLHAALLDDYDFIQLPDDAKGHLMLLWVLASQMDNKIPFDLAWITQRIGARTPVDIEELILRGFLEPYDEHRAKGKLENWASRYVSAQTRADLLSAAQHMCAACGSAEKLEIDHIVPISQGGTGDVSNLQVLCRQCNRRKRAKLQKDLLSESAHLRSGSLRSQNNSALLETEGETETEKEAEAETRVTRPRRVGLTVKPWVRPTTAVWRSNVGKITEAAIQRELGEPVEQHGEEKIQAAIRLYAKAKRSAGKAMKLQWFAEDVVTWVLRADEANQPIVDEHGELTPYGERLTRPDKVPA